MIKLERFVFNMFGENTYLIWDDQTNEAIVVDPGCSISIEEDKLADAINKKGLVVKYLLNTHCHIDHILGNAFIKSKFDPMFLAANEDMFLFDLMLIEAENMGFEMKKSPQPDQFLKDNSPINFAGTEFIPLFTPGHSPGGFSFYFKDSGFCITGDTLFRESIGRTDLWNGDYDKLINSIETRLLTLPDDVLILPGHGDKSTIGHEKENNPFL
ncbi:MAG: MBL fold metallo-hydrolase [Bacteroidota bacterium]|nr:MBL fold metallo-hydrolase [Bacteroidota bacterium]MDP4191245.1 MBL fold metallo-hydrolase [Bacteroidota bacterium]MDP4193601.1 MBL fold metallo-hydrolase [Bacteroidota bacterium]